MKTLESAIKLLAQEDVEGEEDEVAQIAESFINGNISLVRDKVSHSPSLLADVADWLRENAPQELARYLRLMGGR